MKYAHLAQRLYGRPLLLTETYFHTLSSIFQSRINGESPKAFLGDDSDSDGEILPYKTVGKIAIVSLSGPILKNASIMATMCGATDIDTFLSNVTAAYNDSNIDTIILDISSPGGEVTGVKEAADAIRQMADVKNGGKDILSFTDSVCASAAYWIAAATNGIFTTETADIGSIGVFMGLYDQSAAFAMEGIKPVLIKAGNSKADGFPGLPISEETIARYQGDVNQVNDMFRAGIALKRTLDDSTMQGQAVMGINAKALNLSDDIVPNLNSLIVAVNHELTK